MMMVVCPSTSQITSSLCELSRLPRSMTVTGRLALRTSKLITSVRDDAKRPVSGLLMPGTPTRTAAIPSAATAPSTSSLRPRPLRRAGRRNSGRSRAEGGAAGAGPGRSDFGGKSSW